MEELFENLIWVVAEAIAALEFAVGVEAFLEFFPSNEEFAKVLDKNIASKGSMFSNGFGALNYEDQ